MCVNESSIINLQAVSVYCISATDWLVLGMVREESESYFAKLCGEKDQSIISICIFCWIQIPTIILIMCIYTVLYVKSVLVSLDCFCLVRTFIVTTKRPRYSSGALFSVSLSHSSQVRLTVVLECMLITRI